MDFNDSWKDARFDEVEGAIKTKIAQIEGGQIVQISVIPLATLNYYNKGASNVKFTYKVRYTENGDYVSGVRTSISINGQLRFTEEVFPASDTEIVESPNIAAFLSNDTGTADIISIRVTSLRDETIVSSLVNITFRCITAKINISNFFIGRISVPNNLKQLQYICEFSSNKANLVVSSASVRGTNVKGYTVDNIVNSEVDPTVVRMDECLQTYEGVRVVDAYIDLNGNGSSDTVTLEYLNIPSTAANSVFVAVMPVVGAKVYETYSVQYGVYNHNSSTANIKIVFKDANNNVIQTSEVGDVGGIATTASPDSGTTKTIDFRPTTETGSINFYIDNVLIRTVGYVAESSGVNWDIAESCQMYLSAMGKTNAQADHDVWADGGFNTIFRNIPFSTNTSASVVDGFVNNALHLSGKSRAIIQNPIFYDATPYVEGVNGGGILATGRTLTIKFKVDTAYNVNDVIATCFADDLGLIIRPESIYAKFGNALIDDINIPQTTSTNNRRFAAGTENEVTVTISPLYKDGVMVTPEITLYVNGEVAAKTSFNPDSHSMSQTEANKAYIVLGGDGAAANFYHIRTYTRCLTYTEVLHNYALDMQDQSIMLAIYNKNKYSLNNFTTQKDSDGNYQGVFAYCAERSKTGSPCHIITTTDLRTGITNTSDWDQTKIQTLEIYCFRNGVIDTIRSVKYVATAPKGLRIRVQGTSTAAMKDKNLRYDARSVGCYEYRWSNDINNWVQVLVDGQPKIVTKFDIHLKEGGTDIGCSLLTTKTNYNESTATRNLPNALIVDDAINYLYDNYAEYNDILSTPQIEERRIRQSIYGIPALQYYNNGISYSFTGKVDIITDKSNQGVFGFSGDNFESYSIEFRNNGSDQTNFKSCDYSDCLEDQVPSTQSVLQYRYPDTTTAWHQGALTKEGAFLRLCKFVYDCDPNRVGTIWDLDNNMPVSNSIISIHGKVPYYLDDNDNRVYTVNPPFGKNVYYDNNYSVEEAIDSPENRKLKFYAELHEYASVSSFVFNGLISLVYLWTDQRAKNQFFTHFEGDVAIDHNNVEHDIIRLLPYDIDTSWRGDNDSRLRYDFTRLYSDIGIYDDNQSALYRLLDECFKLDYDKMFNALVAGGFMNAEGLKQYYRVKQVEAYSATIYNADTEYKYLTSNDGTDQRFKAHGSAVEDLDWFIKGRMYFMGGLFYGGAGSASSDYAASIVNINLTDNIDIGNNVKLLISSYVRNYVTIWYPGTTYKKIYNEAYVDGEGENEEVELNLSYIGRTGSSDNRLYIYGQKQLRSLGDMSGLQVASISGNLETIDLIIGNTNSSYTNNSFTGFSNTQIFNACKLVNVANCKNIANGYFVNFPIVETIEARGCSSMTSLSLPTSSNLVELNAPANLQSLTITDKPNITTFSIEGVSALNNITCTNSSQTVATAIIDLINDFIE